MIKLEYFEKSDFDQLIEWVEDEQLLTNWAGSLFRFPLSEKSLDWYIEDSNDILKSDVLIYKVIHSESATVVGHVSLGSINRSEGSARITRVLVGNTSERGRGICQGMLKAILQVAFDELKLHRVSLGVYDFNVSAIGCYEKVGFRKEGLMRDVKKFNDKYWSIVEMSILENEWRERNTEQTAPL